MFYQHHETQSLRNFEIIKIIEIIEIIEINENKLFQLFQLFQIDLKSEIPKKYLLFFYLYLFFCVLLDF